jgi:hypothetical protein
MYLALSNIRVFKANKVIRQILFIVVTPYAQTLCSICGEKKRIDENLNLKYGKND